MQELPKHLKYNPCPEIVRAHEQWQASVRQAVSQLQTMGHVRAGEAIANVCMPLFAHVDTLFTLLQADLSAYIELVMQLSQEAGAGDEIIVGLHPADAEAMAELTDRIHATVEKVSKGIKEGSEPRKQLEEALQQLGELQEVIMSTSLEDDEVPDEDEDDLQPAEPTPQPASTAPVESDLSDEPLQIG